MKRYFVTIALAATFVAAKAQYRTPFIYNIAGDKTYNTIVNEASGERTLGYIYDLAPYELTNRNFENMLESEFVLAKCKEFGLKDAVVNRYPAPRPAWVAVEGELWITAPIESKIADIADMPSTLVEGSGSADVTAEVVWIDDLSSGAIENLDLNGKIVMGSASPSQMVSKLKGKGIAGVVSTYAPRPYVDPFQIPNTALRGNEENVFAFVISPIVGEQYKRFVTGSKPATMRVKAEVKEVEYEQQSPSCIIEGSDPDAGTIIFSAHLFEGYFKLGANDNVSGSAAILEVARLINTLIEEGKLERPRCSMHFIWGDEFVGIIPWAEQNPQIIESARCNINLDMVGVSLMKDKSIFTAFLTKYSTSHYLNDIIESLFNYMGDTNSDNMTQGSFSNPVYAPSGSRDPFIYALESFAGYSDHEIFLDPSFMIPSTLYITWPDNQYHSSADRPDKIDATQLKRAVVLSAATAYTIAAADDKKAMEIATLVSSGTRKRMADVEKKMSYNITNYCGANIDSLYKSVVLEVEAVAIAQKAALESIKEISTAKSLEQYIANCQAEVDGQSQSIAKGLNLLIAGIHGKEANFKLSKEEQQAQKRYPQYAAKAKEMGYDALGVRFSRFAKDNAPALISGNDAKVIRDILSGEMVTELAALAANNCYNELEILYMLNAQSSLEDAITLEELRTVEDILVSSGAITIENR